MEALLAPLRASITVQERLVDELEATRQKLIITAPMDGRVSKAEVDVGNLVGADGATLLTTIVQDHPIYVEFEVN